MYWVDERATSIRGLMGCPHSVIRFVSSSSRRHALGFYWAIRGGFNNVTGRKNWIDVNNDIDSPDFLAYNVYNGGAFTGRIRFLGHK